MYGCFIMSIFPSYPCPTNTCLHTFCTGCQVDDIAYWIQHEITYKMVYEGLDWGGGGSGIHFSLKIQPIISLIKILGNSLK